MDRVLNSTPATVSVTYYEDGTTVDPGTVTVGITRANGTTVVAAGTATNGTGAAARTYNLTAANTALLDLLKLTWTSATKGERVTYVEVVGGFLFSLSELDARLTNVSGTYTAAQKTVARTLAEVTIEDACGVAFVPRYRRETLSGSGTSLLLIDRPRIRSVRDATIDGVAVTDTLTPVAGGMIYLSSAWTSGYSNVVVGYEHGYDYPPADVVQAAVTLAKHRLVEGPIDDRATTMTDEFGTWTLATPGLRGSVAGIPDVDAVISRYAMVAGVG